MVEREKIYDFEYTVWGVKKTETKKFSTKKDAVDYAIQELPKKNAMNIKITNEYDYLR